MYQYDGFNRKKFILWTVIITVLLLAAAFGIVVTQFSVTDVMVEGNEDQGTGSSGRDA